MQKLEILKKKQVKKLISELESHYDCKIELKNKIFFKSSKDKVYIISKQFSEINEQKLRINNLGLYLGKFQNNYFRLSIDGAQLIDPKKNVYSLNEKEKELWTKGEDFEIEKKFSGPIILKYKTDIYGCGIAKGKKLLSTVSKQRRIK